MAVDTLVKRSQVLNFGMPGHDLLPFPDGTIRKADRFHLLGLYGQDAAGVIIVPAAVATSVVVASPIEVRFIGEISGIISGPLVISGTITHQVILGAITQITIAGTITQETIIGTIEE